MTPTLLAFPQRETDATYAIDMSMTAVFLLECLLNFFTAYQDEDYQIVDTHKVCFRYHNLQLIAIAYLKGWFTVDFLSSIPIDSFVDAPGGADSFNRYARVARIYKITKLLKLVRAFKTLQTKDKISTHFN